jgi:transaldolase
MVGWNVCPEILPPQTLDRSGHLAWLALSGHPRLAADTILNKELRGRLCKVVGNAVRLLNLAFIRDPASRKRCYEALIEVAFNLIGIERKRAGFSEEEAEDTLKDVIEALKRWESLEKKEGDARVARIVIEELLQDAKRVLMGRSMVARMAEEIEKGLEKDNLMESFILSAKKIVRENIYYRIVDMGISKLGNDSATGLRWVRHLGAVQVSSNPVIAARAFDEVPDLWHRFREVSKAHPEWFEDPEKFGDEIAMYGTITSLLPNLLDFRPIALLSDFHDGLVSYQINPLKATSLEETLKDALKIYGILQEILEKYDAHLMPNTDLEGRGRPNIVFKVAGCTAAAVEITEALNRLGIGTNDTVTYTVAQELTLTMAAMRGLAGALKAGIPITQVYITNMEGRLEDHLREAEAERLLWASLEKVGDKEARIKKLAERLGAPEIVEKVGSLKEKVAILCSKRYLKALTDERFIEALGEKDAKALVQLESDIKLAGVFVTRRVFQIAFRPEARAKWVKYLQEEFGVTEEEAREVVDKVDLLPSSKRRAEDTYLVLGGKGITNLTNTEFPDQQLRVWGLSCQEGFELSRFVNTIAAEPDAAVLKRLLRIEDFRKAYMLTPELVQRLGRVGIEVPSEDGGLRPEDWSSYGPVIKTMGEFQNAYLSFKQLLIDFIKSEGDKEKK